MIKNELLDKIISNIMNQSFIANYNDAIKHIGDCADLMWLFDWDGSVEGFEFWRNLHERECYNTTELAFLLKRRIISKHNSSNLKLLPIL